MRYEHQSNDSLTGTAKALRKSMTAEERRLWYDFLKKLPITVHRQKVIGPYIVDFYIHSAALVIELDGSQHVEDPKQRASDLTRDRWLREQGLEILRYDNRDVRRNFEGVCLDILRLLRERGLEAQL